jgi:hypothetical protein
MKNIVLYFWFVVLLANTFGQNSSDKIYVSDKYGNNLKLILKENKNYQLIYSEGVYNQTKDTMYLTSQAKEKELFTVVPIAQAKTLDSIVLSFTSEIGYPSTYNIAIASSSEESESLNFYPLYYFESSPNTTLSENLIKFKIKKAKFLFIAKKNSATNEYEVLRYEISPKTSELQISENYNAGNKLIGEFNEKGNIVISENGAYPIEFILQDKLTVPEQSQCLTPTKTKDIYIDWNFATLYNPNNDYSVPGSDTIKVTIETTLKEALKNLKVNPQACLIIVNEPKDVFDNFISMHKTSAVDMKYYDETDKNIFDFVFYNLKEDEINWLEKKNFSKNTKLLVLNTNELPVFYSEESVNKLLAGGLYSYEYINLSRQIKSIAGLCFVDEDLLNEKINVPQLKTVLYNATNKLNHISLFPEEINEAANSTTVPASIDSIVEYEYNTSDIPVFRGKFYKSKITKQDLEIIFSRILDYYEKAPSYDRELFYTLYKELNNEGISFKLFGDQKNLSSKKDFRGIDYLLKYYQTACEFENNNVNYDSIDYNNYVYFPATGDIKYLMTNYLSRNLSDGFQENSSMEQKKEIITHYHDYLFNSPSDYYLLNSYVNSLIANRNQVELFSFYENFISRFETQNIIESLNNYYENNYDLNWYDLKNNFSTMANNVSWYVVENKINDSDRIKNAIEWSEMSLKLSRNNAYYMDTLAQLYYMNGDKQKAITTQEKAIDNYKGADVNPETLTEMKNVLEKMQRDAY